MGLSGGLATNGTVGSGGGGTVASPLAKQRPLYTGTKWVGAPNRPPVTMLDVGGVNPAGLKYRGVVFEVKSTGDFYSNYWGASYDSAFIDQQFANAATIGANLIKNIGDPQAVILGGFSQATYLANIKAFLDKALARGFLVYMELTANNAFSGTRPSLAQEVTQAIALAALCNNYPNIVGLDLVNEVNNLQNNVRGGGHAAQPDATSITWVQTLAAAVKGVTDIPICFSLLTSTDVETTAAGVNDWNTLFAANCDFLDFHPYYALGTPMLPAAMVTVHSSFPQMPIMLGEVDALNQTAASANNILVMNTSRTVVELPYVAGLSWFAINDWALGAGGVADGLFDTSNVERTGITYPFRTLPRRNQYGHQTIGLSSAASPYSLTTSLVQIPNAKFLLQNSAFDISQSRDPQYRVSAEIGQGIQFGDSLSLAVVDLDALTTVASGTATGAQNAGASTFADSSANSNVGSIAGNVTSVAGQAGFSNAANLVSGANISLPNSMAWALPMTVECFAQRAAVTAADAVIVGRWHTGTDSVFIIGTAAASNRYYAGAFDSGTVSHFTNAAVNSANDTSWHHHRLVFDGTTMYYFLDGVLAASTGCASLKSVATSTTPFIIGADATLAAQQFLGNVDEVRVSNNARSTSGFTPPAAPFTTDANTLSLLHLDSIIPPGTSNQIQKVSTPWLYVPPGPINAGVQVANTTGARGAVLTTNLEVRYA